MGATPCSCKLSLISSSPSGGSPFTTNFLSLAPCSEYVWYSKLLIATSFWMLCSASLAGANTVTVAGVYLIVTSLLCCLMSLNILFFFFVWRLVFNVDDQWR